MSYRIERGESLEHAVRRIAGEQLEDAQKEVDSDDDVHETIHSVRKRCQKLRALVRLVRPALGEDTYQKANRGLRDAARRLADLRDAAAQVETCDALLERLPEDDAAQPAVEQSLEALRARREAQVDADDARDRLAAFRSDLEALREVVPGWELAERGSDALRGGLVKTYRRGRRALARASAEPAPERFHEWRKRVKYTRYHLRLLGPVWPDQMDVQRRALHRLSDLLGGAHDLVVLTRTLERDEDLQLEAAPCYALSDLVAQRRSDLERAAFALGRLLYAEKPGAFGRRIAAYFDTWEAESMMPGSEARPTRGGDP